jgi:Rab-GTPase-TBC domain
MNKDTSNCTCNQENTNFFLLKGLTLLFPNYNPCWRVAQWEKLSDFPADGEKIYSELIEIQKTAQSSEIHQIDLDLDRTFPYIKYFDDKRKLALRRILVCISLYEPLVGYVQGMNFLVGAILWHTSEYKTFWLMTSLLQKHDLRKNYLPGLPGLSKHAQILEVLLFEQYPSLYCYLSEHRADVSVYITEWCFTLFAKVIPIDKMGQVLHGFFINSWYFFYKIVLAIIFRLKEKLFSLKDPADILTIIKPSEVYKKGRYSFLNSLSRYSEDLTWEGLIGEADSINIDKGYIEFLVSTI